MEVGETSLGGDLLWLYDMSHTRSTWVGFCVDGVDAARAEGGEDEVGTRYGWVVVARGAGIPAGVMGFVSSGEREAMNDRGVGAGGGVAVDGGQVVRVGFVGYDGWDVEEFFSRAFFEGFLWD
jgi:hypothetical protein